MNKLTAEKCRREIRIWERLEQTVGLAIESERHLQAYRIALPILEQQERGEGGWIEWGGGDQPVSDYAVVEVKFRNGSVEKGEFAECYEWNHGYRDLSTTEVDIIAYRIIPEQG